MKLLKWQASSNNMCFTHVVTASLVLYACRHRISCVVCVSTPHLLCCMRVVTASLVLYACRHRISCVVSVSSPTNLFKCRHNSQLLAITEYYINMQTSWFIKHLLGKWHFGNIIIASFYVTIHLTMSLFLREQYRTVIYQGIGTFARYHGVCIDVSACWCHRPSSLWTITLLIECPIAITPKNGARCFACRHW